jgi:hypothetical protein
MRALFKNKGWRQGSSGKYKTLSLNPSVAKKKQNKTLKILTLGRHYLGDFLPRVAVQVGQASQNLMRPGRGAGGARLWTLCGEDTSTLCCHRNARRCRCPPAVPSRPAGPGGDSVVGFFPSLSFDRFRTGLLTP